MDHRNEDLEFLLEKLRDAMSSAQATRTVSNEGSNSFNIDELAIISYFDGKFRGFVIVTPTATFSFVFHDILKGGEYYEGFGAIGEHRIVQMSERSLLSQGLNDINATSMLWNRRGESIAVRYIFLKRELCSEYSILSSIDIGEQMLTNPELIRDKPAAKQETDEYEEQALISMEAKRKSIKNMRAVFIALTLLIIATLGGVFYLRQRIRRTDGGS